MAFELLVIYLVAWKRCVSDPYFSKTSEIWTETGKRKGPSGRMESGSESWAKVNTEGGRGGGKLEKRDPPMPRGR